MAIGAAGLLLEGTAGVRDVGWNGENGAFRGAEGWMKKGVLVMAEEGGSGRGGKGDSCVLWVLRMPCPTLFPVVHP